MLFYFFSSQKKTWNCIKFIFLMELETLYRCKKTMLLGPSVIFYSAETFIAPPAKERLVFRCIKLFSGLENFSKLWVVNDQRFLIRKHIHERTIFPTHDTYTSTQNESPIDTKNHHLNKLSTKTFSVHSMEKTNQASFFFLVPRPTWLLQKRKNYTFERL